MAHERSPGDVRLFDRFATVYDRLKPATDAATVAPALELAERDVTRVLDVGGGSGQGVRGLDVASPLVVDPAPGMVCRAASRGVAAVRGDGRHLPVREASVDAVLLLDALHHMHDREAVIEETARVLRPGGVLAVLEFDPTTLPGRALVAGEHLVGFDSRFYTPSDLAARVRAAGLRASIPRRGFEYLLAGVKPADSGDTSPPGPNTSS